MRTLGLILAMALAGGRGSGGNVSPGRIPVPRMLGPFDVSGGALAGATMVLWEAPKRGRLRAIHFTETTAGTGTSMRYAVTVNGVAVCGLTVACNSTGRQDAVCDDALAPGDEVGVTVEADNCLAGNPAGSIMLTIE